MRHSEQFVSQNLQCRCFTQRTRLSSD